MGIEILKGIAIESGSWLFMLTSAVGVYFVARRRYANHISEFNQSVVGAWGWIAGAILFNAAWYALSRQLAPPGELWNSLMFDYRWLMALATAGAFTYGMISFVALIEDFSATQKCAVLATLAAVSLALGIF